MENKPTILCSSCGEELEEAIGVDGDVKTYFCKNDKCIRYMKPKEFISKLKINYGR